MRYLSDGRVDRSKWKVESLRGENAFVSVIVAVELADEVDRLRAMLLRVGGEDGNS